MIEEVKEGGRERESEKEKERIKGKKIENRTDKVKRRRRRGKEVEELVGWKVANTQNSRSVDRSIRCAV